MKRLPAIKDKAFVSILLKKADSGWSKGIDTMAHAVPRHQGRLLQANVTLPLNRHFGDRRESEFIVPPPH